MPWCFETDEWQNFLERVNCRNEEDIRDSTELEEELRLWASYRGQTLTRTGIDTAFDVCFYHRYILPVCLCD